MLRLSKILPHTRPAVKSINSIQQTPKNLKPSRQKNKNLKFANFDMSEMAAQTHILQEIELEQQRQAIVESQEDRFLPRDIEILDSNQAIDQFEKYRVKNRIFKSK